MNLHTGLARRVADIVRAAIALLTLVAQGTEGTAWGQTGRARHAADATATTGAAHGAELGRSTRTFEDRRATARRRGGSNTACADSLAKCPDEGCAEPDDRTHSSTSRSRPGQTRAGARSCSASSSFGRFKEPLTK